MVGRGPRSGAEVREAVSGRLHMGHVEGCFVPFPIPAGIPSFGELGEQLLMAVKAEYEVEVMVPAMEGSPPVVAPLEAQPPRTHPFFLGEQGKAGRGRKPSVAGGYDPAVALVMHFFVELN